MIDLLGTATDCTGDDRIVGLESRAPPNVEDDRSQFCPKPDIKGLWRHRKAALSIHDRALLALRAEQNLDEGRLTGRLPCPEERTFSASGDRSQALTAYFGARRPRRETAVYRVVRLRQGSSMVASPQAMEN